MLAPGTGKTHRAYLWAYASGAFEALRAVVYDFTDSRAGEHARAFLGEWRGSLVCDDFSGYKAGFALGMTEVGCMAHARRKFVELHLTQKSTIAATAVDFIGQLYGIEREVKAMEPEERLHERRTRAAPIAKALHEWLLAQRTRTTPGTATARAIDYSLKRWIALTRYLDDPALPIDNNFDEQQIRPWATGRNKVNRALMRSPQGFPARAPSTERRELSATTLHNHSACRNAIKAFGGRYRACFASGAPNRARALSFIARSASTYM